MHCFINFSNHPSERWAQDQIEAAKAFGTIEEMPFPPIDPLWTTEEVHALAEEYAEKIRIMEPAYVLCQGEFSFAFALVTRLKALGIRAGAACSERKVREVTKADGTTEKTAIFKFIRFRDY